MIGRKKTKNNTDIEVKITAPSQGGAGPSGLTPQEKKQIEKITILENKLSEIKQVKENNFKGIILTVT